jgi:hypothetical protein
LGLPNDRHGIGATNVSDQDLPIDDLIEAMRNAAIFASACFKRAATGLDSEEHPRVNELESAVHALDAATRAATLLLQSGDDAMKLRGR